MMGCHPHTVAFLGRLLETHPCPPSEAPSELLIWLYSIRHSKRLVQSLVCSPLKRPSR